MFRDDAILPNEFPAVLPNPSLSPFPIRHYNWSDSGGNDSMWLSFGVQCVYSNAVLQPVTHFCFSSRGKLAVPSLQAPLLCIAFLCLLAAVRALPTILFHFLRKTKKIKDRVCTGSKFSLFKEYKWRIWASGCKFKYFCNYSCYI